jgi:hypothetical protein
VPRTDALRRPSKLRLLGRDFLGQRSGTAAAGHAAESGELKAERIERVRKPRLCEHRRNHPRSRRERGLDPGLGAQSSCDRVPGEQPGGDHLVGICGIGARCDGRDGDVPVLQRPRDGRDWRRLGRCRALRGKRATEILRRIGECDEAFRPRWSRDCRRDAPEVELEHRLESRLLGTPHSLRLGVALDKIDQRVGAAGLRKIPQRLGVDGEEPHRRAVLRRHVRNCGAVSR